MRPLFLRPHLEINEKVRERKKEAEEKEVKKKIRGREGRRER